MDSHSDSESRLQGYNDSAFFFLIFTNFTNYTELIPPFDVLCPALYPPSVGCAAPAIVPVIGVRSAPALCVCLSHFCGNASVERCFAGMGIGQGGCSGRAVSVGWWCWSASVGFWRCCSSVRNTRRWTDWTGLCPRSGLSASQSAPLPLAVVALALGPGSVLIFSPRIAPVKISRELFCVIDIQIQSWFLKLIKFLISDFSRFFFNFW